jgi:hypothetical protein
VTTMSQIVVMRLKDHKLALAQCSKSRQIKLLRLVHLGIR